ncbi:MAG: radical SAM protein [Thermodesulfovibrio sp.]|nr:radical SAM protein [Thermodesulfovibrio sp.]
MILVHPPVAKPGEPPAGIARLSGALSAHAISHTLLDANLEGMLYLLQQPRPRNIDDAWSRRAFRNVDRNISIMKNPELYRNMDRYSRAVMDLGRLLEVVSGEYRATVGLANYQHETLSPLKSEDLLSAAERPELNPYYSYFQARLTGLVIDREPEFIGFSLNYLSQALCTFAMIGFIKREFPTVKVILGGGLVTSWMRSPFWQNPFSGLVDSISAGRGEEKLLSLFSLSAEGPFTPGYQTMSRTEYLSPGFILPYSASEGCFWNQCNFCPEKAEGNPYIPVPVNRVLADLEVLAEKTDPVLIHLLDSAVAPALMAALDSKGPRVPWYGFARVCSQLTDPDFCLALKRSGCVMLKLGLESADQLVLDRMEKGISVDMALQAMKTLKKAGIAVYVYLIFGTPAENLQRARKTLEFVAAHGEYIDFLNLAVFNMPVCGSGAYVFETRRFYDGDLSLYTDFSHPEGWGRKQVRHFLDNEFRKHPVVTRIQKKDPVVFTSNHAPFFVKNRQGNP